MVRLFRFKLCVIVILAIPKGHDFEVLGFLGLSIDIREGNGCYPAAYL